MKLQRIEPGELYTMINAIEDEDVVELLSVASYCLGYMLSGRHDTTIQVCAQLKQIVEQCADRMNQMENE